MRFVSPTDEDVPTEADALAELDRVHAAVDRAASALARRHSDRLQCHRGCSGCCVDRISVFEVEAAKLRRDFPELLREGRPHPAGACAFLDADGACRVYASRPYVCRTQGLPLRWTERQADGRVLEYRDICPLNVDAERPVEGLAADDCWTLGRVEASLASLQALLDHGRRRRVRLRSLFRRSDPLQIPVREAQDQETGE